MSAATMAPAAAIRLADRTMRRTAFPAERPPIPATIEETASNAPAAAPPTTPLLNHTRPRPERRRAPARPVAAADLFGGSVGAWSVIRPRRRTASPFARAPPAPAAHAPDRPASDRTSAAPLLPGAPARSARRTLPAPRRPSRRHHHPPPPARSPTDRRTPGPPDRPPPAGTRRPATRRARAAPGPVRPGPDRRRPTGSRSPPAVRAPPDRAAGAAGPAPDGPPPR